MRSYHREKYYGPYNITGDTQGGRAELAPTVSVKNPSLSMPARGKIDLGLSVTTPDSADASVDD
jgi:hypothetical protein